MRLRTTQPQSYLYQPELSGHNLPDIASGKAVPTHSSTPPASPHIFDVDRALGLFSADGVSGKSGAAG